MNKFYALILSLIVGVGIFSLFSGLLLGLIFFFIWIDKVVFGLLGIPNKFGLEFITMSTVLLGIEYGPVNGFLFALIIIPLVEGAKYKIFELPSEWPPFVPGPDHFADAIVAVVASYLVSFEFLIIVIIILVIKNILQYGKFMMMGKPPDVLTMTFSTLFNLLLAFYLGDLFVSFLSVPVPI